jgi:hypothetical protein
MVRGVALVDDLLGKVNLGAQSSPSMGNRSGG